MHIPRRPPWRPQPKIEYEHAPDYSKEAAWLEKKLEQYGGNLYLCAGEAAPELYERLEEPLKRAKDEHNVDIHVLAGPVISIPAGDGLKKRQEGREYLNPVVRLAKEEIIQLYPSEKRLPQNFELFIDIDTGHVQEPCALGEAPGAGRFIYNWWCELAEYELLINHARFSKEPVTKDFTEHFLFLTDAELADLRKWVASKGKNIMEIDLATCREFWADYSSNPNSL